MPVDLTAARRRYEERLMTVTIRFTRPARDEATTLNRATLGLNVPAPTNVYEGKASVRPERRNAKSTEGDKPIRRGAYVVTLPWATAQVPEPGDLGEVLDALDDYLIGKVLRVDDDPQGGDMSIGKRLPCLDTKYDTDKATRVP